MNFVGKPSPKRTVMCRRGITAVWAAAWVGVSLGLATGSALAQTGYGSGPGRPAVEVDLSVLDRLGRRTPAPRPVPGIQPRIEPRPALRPAPAAGAWPPPAVGPLPPPGMDGLRHMQRSINAWALGTSADVAEPAALPRPSTAPSTLSARRSAPPPAPVAPARRTAPKSPAKPLIVAPPPPPPTPEVVRVDPPPPKPAPEPKAAQPDPPPPQPAIAANIAPGPDAPAGLDRDAPPAAAQIATRTPAALPPGTWRIGFDSQSSDIAEAVKSDLDAVAARMTSQSAMRLELRAFAEGTEESASQARRLSLVRALAVRSYLMKKGVRSTRMDVRALGTKSEDGPADRVDVVLFER